MNRPVVQFLILVLMGGLAPAWSQQPVVRVAVEPPVINVGESAELKITVLVPTWFRGPPGYPSFELANTITRLPPDSSYPMSERVGRDTWSGIVRNYRVYPLMGANYRLSGQTMAVTYADPENRQPVTVQVPVPEISFSGRVPAGAEGLDPYLAGRRLELTRDLEGDHQNLNAGDALVVRYVAELEGMPAIFLPGLVTTHKTPGVAIYPETPVMEDGDTARRSEKLTYVFDVGGNFEIPEAELLWWNTETSAIETARLPAISISVAGAPISTLPDSEPGRLPWAPALGWGVVVLVLLMMVSRVGPGLQKQWIEYRQRKLASEEHAFRLLIRALGTGDGPAVHRAMLHWLARFDGGTDARQFAGEWGDEELLQQIEALNRAVFLDETEVPDLSRMKSTLASARRQCRLAGRQKGSTALPPLNP